MPPGLLSEFNELPLQVQQNILREFAQIDNDVETRVDNFLAQAVNDANGWHPKQALIGLTERRRASEEVLPLVMSAGTGVGLAIAQGALVAAGVAAGAVSFGIIPVAGIVLGVAISAAKSEYQHHTSGKRLHAGIKQLNAKRGALQPQAQQGQQAAPFGDPGYLGELKAVMNEAGEKINRKYLRVARIGKASTSMLRNGASLLLHHGSPHMKEARDSDKTQAAQLVAVAWKTGSVAKDESLSLAVLELHFYASTVYQELAQFINWVSAQRTEHLNRMTNLRGHIIRQLHLVGNHDNCGDKCGKPDDNTFDNRCKAIADSIRAAARQELARLQAAKAAAQKTHGELLAQKTRLLEDHGSLVKQRDVLQARTGQLQTEIAHADTQRGVFNAQQAGAQLTRRYELRDTNQALAQVNSALAANEADRLAKLGQGEQTLNAALADFTAASDLLVKQESTLKSLFNSNIDAAGFKTTIAPVGWTRNTIKSQDAMAEVNRLKADSDIKDEIAENEVVGAAIDYGVDVSLDQLGEVVEQVADKAANVSTAVGIGAVVEVSIDILKDLYQNRQTVRRLHAFGRARDTPWTKLEASARDTALEDLEKIGLKRENLGKVGQRISHYLDKMAEIEGQIAKLQEQAPYSDMFKEKLFANSIFASCSDAINAWYLCCYKDKQFAKLEASILAFQMLLLEMEKKLASQSYGAVVTKGTLISKIAAPSKPSYYQKMD